MLLATAPLLMPDSYDWIVHTTSESAAQGVEWAWVARMGFAAFGITVISLSVVGPPSWSGGARAAHFAFGAFMTMAAAASAQPWFEPATYDATEDWVHSFAATAMGFAFALGVVVVAISRVRVGLRIRALDLVAVVASVAIPLGMVEAPDAAGVLQRAMFLIAYVWYGQEALGSTQVSDRPVAEVPG
jgi:hypothetical protein